MTSPENPGSIKDFLEANKNNPNAEEDYYKNLGAFRLALANELGISLDDLHDMKFPHDTIKTNA